MLFRQLNIQYRLTSIADSYFWGNYNATSDTFDGLIGDLKDGVCWCAFYANICKPHRSTTAFWRRGQLSHIDNGTLRTPMRNGVK